MSPQTNPQKNYHKKSSLGLLLSTCLFLLISTGCTHRPFIYNPYPELSTVAVVPFFNLSMEPSVDGRMLGNAYYMELQKIPGFEVIPVGVVEKTILSERIDLNSPEEAQILARKLGADAVVIGAVTDYTPYYPPRLGLQVEWYAADAAMRPIPAGWGLPWGTPEEENIPKRLKFEAEIAAARVNMREPRLDEFKEFEKDSETDSKESQEKDSKPEKKRPLDPFIDDSSIARMDTYHSPIFSALQARRQQYALWNSQYGLVTLNANPNLQPVGSSPQNGAIHPIQYQQNHASQNHQNRYDCPPSAKPVMTHIQVFNGNEEDFTKKLETYAKFQDDERFVGWRTYLQRSQDFTRFCCHLHISEMLTARGGAGEADLVLDPRFRRYKHNRVKW